MKLTAVEEAQCAREVYWKAMREGFAGIRSTYARFGHYPEEALEARYRTLAYYLRQWQRAMAVIRQSEMKEAA